MSSILVIDDDAHIREVVSFALKKAGFQVETAGDGSSGLAAARSLMPDLVILDILMPELDGLAVCRELRTSSEVPIIFLSSVDEELDRVVGLELGADDYVTKPFSPRELVARVKTVLRRVGKATSKPKNQRVLVQGELRVDLDLRRVLCNDKEVELTATEFNLITALLGFPGKVYTRYELMQRAYPDGTIVSERTIDSHLKRMRRKFEGTGIQPIDTVHGVGYRIAPVLGTQ
jgi:two-component system, OmpR family, response regulator